MPGKSQYIEAPFTMDTFVQSVKDAFEFAGYDVNQTSDDSLVFDSEYWRAKQTTSLKNKVPESEQLVFPFDDWAEAAHTNASFDGWQTGMEWFITQNTDTNYPFKLINNFAPRMQEFNNYHSLTATGLKTSTNYTVSFWARLGNVNGGGKMMVSSGPNAANPTSYKALTDIGTLTADWQRFSYTVNTGGNTTLHHRIGGGNSWSGAIRTNILRASDSPQNTSYWGRGNVTVTDETSDLPPLYKGMESGFPARLVFNSASLGAVNQQVSSPTSILNKTYTFSIYAKKITGAPYIIFDNGITGSVKTTITEDGWTRYSTTVTFTSNASYINVYIAGVADDSALFWGAQLEEGATASTYNPTGTTGSIPNPELVKTYGYIQYAGLQIEEGTSVTAYEPVRVWHFKPYPGGPLVVNDTLQNQNQDFCFNIPGGIDQTFMSVQSFEAYGSGLVPSHTFWNTTTGATELRSHGISTSAVRYLGGVNESSKTMYNNVAADSLRYLSDGLRLTWGRGNGSTDIPIGNAHFMLTFGWTDFTGVKVWKKNFKVYGMAFKLSTASRYTGMTRATGLTLHQKTPGNGRRKFTNIFFREDATKVYMTVHTPIFNLTNSGVAEKAGYLVPQFTPPYTNTAPFTAAARQNGGGYNEYFVYGFPQAMELLQYESFDKNADTFSFVQGAADGFVYALNVNSNFKFKYAQADLVNSPMTEDNGTLFSRFAVGFPHPDNKVFKWYAHGPFIGINNYGTTFGNTYRVANTQLAFSVTSKFQEVFGDDTDLGASAASLIMQCYCVAGENAYVSTRGQLKNFFMVPTGRFLGAEGDLIIAEDGSKYFGFTKSTGNPAMAMLVKV